jgi:protein-disulfide isomerase
MFKKLSIILSVLSLIIAIWAAYQVKKKPQTMTGEDTNAVYMVEEALNQKPELILTALEVYKQRMQLKEDKEMKEQVSKNKADIIDHKGDPVGGNPEGDVTVVNFFDYRCGYCRKAYGILHEAVKNDGKTRIIYKEFPIFGGDMIMSKAALAAQKQGKYEDMHQAFMTSTGNLTLSEVKEIARQLNLDVEKLASDMKSEDIEKEIKENLDLGQKLKITGTPTFIIGDDVISGLIGIDTFEEKIKKQRS